MQLPERELDPDTPIRERALGALRSRGQRAVLAQEAEERQQG